MKFGLPPWLKRGGDEPHEPVPCEPPRLMPGIELTPEERKGGWTEETLAEYQEAGTTWWIEAVWSWLYLPPHDIENLRRRIRQGPPRVA